MKQRHFILLIVIAQLFTFCASQKRNSDVVNNTGSVIAYIDLVKVKNDKVMVTVMPPPITSETISYQMPKIVPGTYSIEDYGRYIDAFTAIDKSGKELQVSRVDSNTWTISNATQLREVHYLVNDTYDIEKGNDVFSEKGTTIFSPAGTNILADKNFVLNMPGFVGFFTGLVEKPYKVIISHPAHLYGATALIDMDASENKDEFNTSRYAELADCPVMYSDPDLARFVVDDMEVLLSVYSVRNKNITATLLEPGLKKMITAQKNFLGDLNTTKKYAVLNYVTTSAPGNATGIGALEHNTSTMAVFRENMSEDDLVHVISHEFFHTVTPLKMHSKEIHYFDFSNPDMSEHLWFYEGITEYFAQMFQVNQGLVSENHFLDVVAEMELSARTNFVDSISFLRMSKQILDPKMKAQYPNVYKKGPLIGMCLDLILRKNSNGERGLLDLMKDLSKKYGADQPFDDSELIPVITQLTYPEVGAFLQQHVVKGNAINYAKYLAYAGVEPATVPIADPIIMIHEKKPYVMIDTTKGVFVKMPDNENVFFNTIGLQQGDRIISINNEQLNHKDMMSVFIAGYGMKEGKPVSMTIERKGKKMELKAMAKLNYTDGPGYRFKDQSKKALYDAWLKGK